MIARIHNIVCVNYSTGTYFFPKQTAIMKIFYNGKKIPLIPPLLNDKLESDFGKKETHFNEFFASKCTPLNNRSTLPHQGLIQKVKSTH